MARIHRTIALAFAASLLLPGSAAHADEGYWTFDDPPTKRLREAYGFAPTAEWFDRLRLASVRFMDGGSGSFVSPEGLMITNHHVGYDCIQNLSSQQRDYVADGFLAATREQELACPGYEVNVLLSTQDVTARLRAAERAAADAKAAQDARGAEIGRIQNECAAATGLRCDVVTLYGGGEFRLYRYKKYTDVRLVFAPEEQLAFFGGDPDNFTFPRHDLDIAFFRAYEQGRPARPAAFLPWSRTGVAQDELVLVSGNPGSTARLKTLAELETLRDATLPLTLRFIDRRLAALSAYSARGPEQARRALAELRSFENGQKAYRGRLAALEDAKAMAGKALKEQELRATGASLLSGEDPWAEIAAAQEKLGRRAAEARHASFKGAPRLLTIAANVVRLVAERVKPNEKRLAEYGDAQLPSLTNELYSPAPIAADLDEAVLADYLQQARDVLGAEHPFVKATLAGREAKEVARAAVAGTGLADPAQRRKLVAGGVAAVAGSEDPMIALARAIDPLDRELRRWTEQEVDAAVSRAAARIAGLRFEVYGRALSPDATFTLRLSYGAVKAYPAEGTRVAPFTSFHGLYDRWASWGGRAPWNLPRRVLDAKQRIALETPLNFASTAETIGGNSGSPTVNAAGEFVGIIFDGNIQSLALDYFYTEEQSRSVSVDARGILEALRSIYGAEALLRELSAESR
ncbi:MAG: S46 family peptidase [Vicinamibacteria bacterium]